MEHAFKAETSWDKNTETQDHISMDLDLDFHDLMTVQEDQDIGETLELNKNSIRTDIFKRVKGDILPKIIEVSENVPGQKLSEVGGFNTHASINNKYSTETSIERENKDRTNFKQESRNLSPESTLDTSSKMHIDMNLSSSQSVHPIEALERVIGEVASNIAETTLFALQNIYQGKESFHVENNWEGDDYTTTELN